MELGRIVHMVDGDGALFIRRTWLTKIFVIGDIFSFLVQSSGAGLLSSGNARLRQRGEGHRRRRLVRTAHFLRPLRHRGGHLPLPDLEGAYTALL